MPGSFHDLLANTTKKEGVLFPGNSKREREELESTLPVVNKGAKFQQHGTTNVKEISPFEGSVTTNFGPHEKV